MLELNDFANEISASYIFSSEEEAIFALYEQIFCRRGTICPETILNSMRYLIFSKNMEAEIEEIQHMDANDVDVIHKKEIEEEASRTTQEIKKSIYNTLGEI